MALAPSSPVLGAVWCARAEEAPCELQAPVLLAAWREVAAPRAAVRRVIKLHQRQRYAMHLPPPAAWCLESVESDIRASTTPSHAVAAALWRDRRLRRRLLRQAHLALAFWYAWTQLRSERRQAVQVRPPPPVHLRAALLRATR